MGLQNGFTTLPMGQHDQLLFIFHSEGGLHDDIIMDITVWGNWNVRWMDHGA